MLEALANNGNMEKGDLVRFKWWTVGLVSSFVTTFAYANEFHALVKKKGVPFRDTWIFYSGIATAIISIAGLLLCVLPRKERSICRVDSILVWVNAILWIVETAVEIIGGGVEKTIVSEFQFVFKHPNAYFFSLLGFAVSLLLVASWFKEFISRGDQWSAFTSWLLLSGMGFFTMLSVLYFRDQIVFGELDQSNPYNITRSDLEASVFSLVSDYKLEDTSTMENISVEHSNITNITESYLANANSTGLSVNDPIQESFEALVEAGVLKSLHSCEVTTYSCLRITYALGLSAATATVASMMVPLKGSSPTCQTDIAIVLLLIWLPSLSILTISPGPATLVGNIYFGTYICYFLVLDIFVTSVTSTVSTEKSENITVIDLGSNKLESRDELWQAAYGKLERKANTGEEERNRSDSYEAMFEEPECWENEEIERSPNPIDGFRLRLSSSPAAIHKTNWNYASRFNINQRIVEGIDEDEIESSSDRTGFVILGDWKQRKRRLRLWCVLLTMAIVLVQTLSQYDYPLVVYTVPVISLSLSCLGIVTCFRSSKRADIIQILSVSFNSRTFSRKT